MSSMVTIEKVIAGGKGLARSDDGMVVMIPGVLPGERVEIGDGRLRSGYWEAESLSVDNSHPKRVVPLCSYYGECGGCDLQHADYDLQLEIKRDIVIESLIRAGVECDEGVVRSVLPSPVTFGYRHRIRCQVSADGMVGFFQRGSKTVVGVAGCLTATKPINDLLEKLGNDQVRTALSSWCTELELLHSPGDDTVALVASVKSVRRDIKKRAQRVVELLGVKTFFLRKGRHIEALFSTASDYSLSQIFRLFSGEREVVLSWGVGCFSQVNGAQNEQLVELTTSLLGDIKGTRMLDLYCGAGNFSIPFGSFGARGMGVEQSSLSIEWAQRNAVHGLIKDWKFIAADVELVLKGLVKKEEVFDILICDPPRRGLGKAVQGVGALKCRKIVYISCDPATLARDIKVLQSMGARLVSLTPVDMFPQTHHIESVALLEKN
ncbi:MAG: class I SAM-dependent RNA methyltransferase [Desulfobulbaceae bacterium]|nr:class I SAM-dependent RNA methyltransferase [Desulfobulbaceae bacterium]